jgi:hypothetical protein
MGQNTTTSPTQFQDKLVKLRRRVSQWRKGRIGDINSQEEACKLALKWMEQQKERRYITSLEKLVKKYKLQKRSSKVNEQRDNVLKREIKVIVFPYDGYSSKKTKYNPYVEGSTWGT